MSSRGKKTVWIAVAFAVVFLLFVVSTTFQGDRVGVEVCMVFHGQRDCRKAQAKDRQQDGDCEAGNRIGCRRAAGENDEGRRYHRR